MHSYEVALIMNEKRLTNSFKSYIGLDDDEQVKLLKVFIFLISFFQSNILSIESPGVIDLHRLAGKTGKTLCTCLNPNKPCTALDYGKIYD